MKLKILEGTKVYDQDRTCLGVLELEEGYRSEPMIILESAEFSDLHEVQLTESDLQAIGEAKLGRGILLALEGRFQHADLQNANKRMYPDKLWDRILAPSEKWLKRLSTNRMLGECDHPSDGQTMLSRVSHLVTKLYRNPDNPKEIRGRLVVFDTPQGRILKGIHEGGGRLGVSSRGKGSVVRRDGVDIVQEDFDLDTFDAVHNPSTPDAYPDVVSESTEVRESTQSNVRQENTEMSRLQELSERLGRLQKHEVSTLEMGALGVISEEVESITSVLTTENFGEDAPKAAMLAIDARELARDLKERKATLEASMPDKNKNGTDVLGKPGKPTSGVPAGEPKKNWMGMEGEDGNDDEDKDKQKEESALNEPGFVKDKSDEKLWSKSKRAAGHAGADNKYAFANWFFHKQKNEACEFSYPRPQEEAGIKRIVEGLDSDSPAEEAALKECAQQYRNLFDVEGRLFESEVAALQAHAKNLAVRNQKLEERAKSAIKAKITFGDSLAESSDDAIEIQAASEADLRRQVQERIEGRTTGLVFIEIDRSESIYKECADRFTPVLESQTLKTVDAVNEAAAVRAELDEVSPKLASAVQVIEALAARVKASDENLDETKSDFETAVEILEALADEYKAERLRGVVEGIASTHPAIDGLAESISGARSPEQAIGLARTLIEEKQEFLREALPSREALLNEALNASEDARVLAEQERQEKDDRSLRAPPAPQEAQQNRVMESTHRVVDRMKALGGI